MLSLLNALDQPRSRTQFVLNVVFSISPLHQQASIRLAHLQTWQPFFIEGDNVFFTYAADFYIWSHIARLAVRKIPPWFRLKRSDELHCVRDFINGHS